MKRIIAIFLLALSQLAFAGSQINPATQIANGTLPAGVIATNATNATNVVGSGTISSTTTGGASLAVNTATTALNAMGYAQSWHSVTRSPGTVYTNPHSNQSMQIAWSVTNATAGSPVSNAFYVNGATAFTFWISQGQYTLLQAIIPPGATYSLQNIAGYTYLYSPAYELY